MKKIAILCLNPWEGFLSTAAQSCIREYYEWFCCQAERKNAKFCIREQIEVYGEPVKEKSMELFSATETRPQILYIQSHQRDIIANVFEKADLVMMGIPGNRREFDKIFLPVFPWKDRIVFLWDQQICRGGAFLEKLCRECRIRADQLIELPRGTDGKLKSV